jgi:uncharacterized tellurite resistance protein B-like protein
LILIANADGKIKDVEYQMLLGLAENLGLNKTEFEQVFQTGIQVKMPVQLGDRILQFHRMVLLMNVDEVAADKEKEMIRVMGTMLGLNQQAVELVLSEMSFYPNNLIPPDRMIQIFTKYLN